MMVIAGRLSKDFGIPYFGITAMSNFLIFGLLVAVLYWLRTAPESWHQFKWLTLRGLSGAVSFVAVVGAVRLGASPGDAAAMTSINTILAALLGRLLLAERLRWVHGVAVAASVAGSVLICRPSFLFGSEAHDAAAVLGFFVAALSGFFQAGIFITQRKLNGVPMVLVSAFPFAFIGLLFGVMPITPLVSDPPMEIFSSMPLLGVALVLGMALVIASSTAALTAGASWCSAAVSATVNTGSKILASYAAQTLLFGETPQALTMIGAGLMFGAVVIMAAARVPGSSEEDPRTDLVDHDPIPQESPAHVAREGADVPSIAIEDSNEMDADSETVSLASFIAAEFVNHEGALRFRRTAPKKGAELPESSTSCSHPSAPPPQVVGTALSAAFVLTV